MISFNNREYTEDPTSMPGMEDYEQLQKPEAAPRTPSMFRPNIKRYTQIKLELFFFQIFVLLTFIKKILRYARRASLLYDVIDVIVFRHRVKMTMIDET